MNYSPYVIPWKNEIFLFVEALLENMDKVLCIYLGC